MIEVRGDVLVKTIVEELSHEFGDEYYEAYGERIEEEVGPALARRVLVRIQAPPTPTQGGGV